MRYFVTGDTHGHNASRIMQSIGQEEKGEVALIILGDSGFNFYLNRTDEKNKRICQDLGYIIYCVRGNHEERPENIKGMEEWYDEEIEGVVYRQPQYPNIRYLIDGNVYLFNNHPTLVIGGAYSIDKWYRLAVAPKGATWTGWFKDEQLTQEEMSNISEKFKDRHFDFILSHTCPIDWEPKDLFLRGIDQSQIDKTMEIWLNDFKKTISWDAWLFGHYHDDRLVRPGVEMFYIDYDDIEEIYQRWTASGEEIPWWMKKDPNYDIE